MGLVEKEDSEYVLTVEVRQFVGDGIERSVDTG